jgi:hypothetical protein
MALNAPMSSILPTAAQRSGSQSWIDSICRYDGGLSNWEARFFVGFSIPDPFPLGQKHGMISAFEQGFGPKNFP